METTLDFNSDISNISLFFVCFCALLDSCANEVPYQFILYLIYVCFLIYFANSLNFLNKHELIDNRRALVLKLLTDFLFLFFILRLHCCFQPTYKKKKKEKEDMALLSLTKIKTPLNLHAMALLPLIKNTHRAKWILRKMESNCRIVDHQINSNLKSRSSWYFSGKYGRTSRYLSIRIYLQYFSL